MADEKNTDVKATSEELNDEALKETSAGFEIHNKYIMWSIKCLDWDCGAVDAPILPIGQMPERKCLKCGGTNVDVNPHYLQASSIAVERFLVGDGALRAAPRTLRGLRSFEQGLQRKSAELNKIAPQVRNSGPGMHFQDRCLVIGQGVRPTWVRTC